MNLILDIGNTRAKVAVFEYDQLIEQKIFNDLLVCDIELFLHKYSTVKSCIMADTGKVDDKVVQFLNSAFQKFIQLNDTTSLPFKNNYETKSTQGSDRIAAVAGAQLIFPDSNVLVIDTGTAITYDFIDTAGNYRGGNISPGLETRFKALHTFTEKLPLLSQSENFDLLANNTQQAIISGVINGVIFEIEGYISRLSIDFPEMKTIITGGDAEFLANKLKRTIFVHSNLVLKGLNRILEYNAV